MRRLAALVHLHRDTPKHLKEHARTIQLLSLDELHAHQDHTRYTMEVIVIGTDLQTTSELEASHTWLTQAQLDRAANHRYPNGTVIYHNDQDRIEVSGNGTALIDLANADIKNAPQKWSSGQAEYCFQDELTEETKRVFRAAVAQLESEVNALGQCMSFTETTTCDLNQVIVVTT
jgi:hypothetical protein